MPELVQAHAETSLRAAVAWLKDLSKGGERSTFESAGLASEVLACLRERRPLGLRALGWLERHRSGGRGSAFWAKRVLEEFGGST